MVRGIGWTGLNLERNIANSAAAGVLDVEFERRVEMAPEFDIHRHGRIEFRVDKATVEQDAHNRGPGHHAGEQKHAHVWPVASATSQEAMVRLTLDETLSVRVNHARAILPSSGD